MGFTGYVPTTDVNNNEFRFNPFIAGQKFRFIAVTSLKKQEGTDASGNAIYKQDDEGNDILFPGFTTSFGDAISLSDLYRSQITVNAGTLVRDTQLAKDVTQVCIANRHKSTNEAQIAILNKIKDRDIVVKAVVPFKATNKNGETYDSSFRIYEYADAV